MTKKVYCKDCVYLERHKLFYDVCNYRSKGSYYSPDEETFIVGNPASKNRFNDCIFYRKKNE